MNLFLKILFSLIVAFTFSVGRSFDLADMLVFSFKSLVLPFLIIAVCTFLILNFAEWIVKKYKTRFLPKENRMCVDKKHILTKCLIPLFFWTLTLLSTFPGLFSYDSKEEWEMMRDGLITSHHPVLHVVILGGLAEVSNNLFGTGNPGIFVYVLLQLFIYIFVFKQLFELFLQAKVSEKKQWSAVAFFTLSPIIQMFSILTSKDSIFGIFELWFFVCIIKCHYNDNIFESKKDRLQFVLATLGTAIFRKNGIYIVVIALTVFFIRNRNEKKKLAILYGIITFVYLLYIGPFYRALDVQAGSVKEMLSVPIQQIARVHYFARDSFEEEDKELLYSIIPKEGWESYKATVSDPVKADFNEEVFVNNKIKFLQIWIKEGIKHPKLYIDSFMINTVDFWYPLARNDGYRGLYGIDTTKSNFFSYKVYEPGTRIVILKHLNEYYTFLSEYMFVGTWWYTSIFLNPGWYILAWIGLLFYDISKKQRCRIEYHFAMALSLFTVLLGPIAAIRYVYIFYLAVPIAFLRD